MKSKFETRNHWELMFGAPDVVTIHQRSLEIAYEESKYHLDISLNGSSILSNGQSTKG